MPCERVLITPFLSVPPQPPFLLTLLTDGKYLAKPGSRGHSILLLISGRYRAGQFQSIDIHTDDFHGTHAADLPNTAR